MDERAERREEIEELACWLLLTFKCGLSTQVVNAIIVSWCQQQRRSLREFFAVDSQEREVACQLKATKVATVAMLTRLERACKQDMQAENTLKLPLLTEQISLIKQLSYDDIHILTLLDERYPRRLKETLKSDQLPPVLFYSGDMRILDKVTIAIIGSRNAGEEHIMFARATAHCLAKQGVNVISGYARGVDRAAYEGATETQGYTTVVLPHGINKLSNTQMYNLLPKIVAGNVLLLSQFHPDVSWHVSRAMARNSLVTGLAEVVIVAAASTQGGTWSGAIGALEQKRPVYVCQTLSSTPGNQALIGHGARPLSWSSENSSEYAYTTDVLQPLVHEGNILQQERKQSDLAQQITRLIKEQQGDYNYN